MIFPLGGGDDWRPGLGGSEMVATRGVAEDIAAAAVDEARIGRSVAARLAVSRHAVTRTLVSRVILIVVVMMRG